MNIIDIIAKKRDKKKLTNEEIFFFVNEYTKNNIKDYQISALLMAIYINGMDDDEIINLTNAMLHSGNVIDLSDIKGIKSDKHSTGGVGDKTSLVLGPLVASCGVKFAKMSGRGLGHTGGTLDKLESIPNMSINLNSMQFKNQVNKINIAIIGQTNDLVPADKKLYALRDVTATIDVISLIASSIMSKKLASGSDTFLLDVKVGSGAFMKTINDAQKLANMLIFIGKKFKKDTRAIITNMQEPLGLAIGNNLEVKEAILTLKNKGPEDFSILCKKCAEIILLQSHIAKNSDEAKKIINEKLNNGEAFNKFKEFIKAQGGDISYIDNPNKFPIAKNIITIKANNDGYIEEIIALKIGEAAMQLGAGRKTKEDVIDFSAGIVLNKKVGDKINKNDILCYVYTNKNDYDEILINIKNAFIINKNKIDKPKIIIDYIE